MDIVFGRKYWLKFCQAFGVLVAARKEGIGEDERTILQFNEITGIAHFCDVKSLDDNVEITDETFSFKEPVKDSYKDSSEDSQKKEKPLKNTAILKDSEESLSKENKSEKIEEIIDTDIEVVEDNKDFEQMDLAYFFNMEDE